MNLDMIIMIFEFLVRTDVSLVANRFKPTVKLMNAVCELKCVRIVRNVYPEAILGSRRFFWAVALQIFHHSHESAVSLLDVFEFLLQFENQSDVNVRLSRTIRFRRRLSCRLRLAVRRTVGSVLIPVDSFDSRVRSRR